MKKIPAFSGQQLEAIAKVLGDTKLGLTGTEIGYILSECRIADVAAGETKWKRLYNALANHQNTVQSGNHVVGFIHKAMNPVRYLPDPDLFRRRRDNLNEALAFAGLHLREDGKLRWVSKASTITEAKQKADHLRSRLQERNVHPDVLIFCNAAWLVDNYFHAVFEAMKSITAKVQRMSGLTSDGAELIRDSFSLGKESNPLLAINPLATETDLGEQRGFVNLLTGLYGVVRNRLAHDPKIEWEMNEQDALDILTTISLIHRKLDKVTRRRSTG